MASVFTKIVRGEIPCHRVYEDDQHLAFLDLAPIQPGHVLVVPKTEQAYLFDLDPAAQSSLWSCVRQVEAGLRQATGCERVVVMVVGWEVPHVHVHLIPTNDPTDVPVPPKKAQSPEELRRMAQAVAAACQNLRSAAR